MKTFVIASLVLCSSITYSKVFHMDQDGHNQGIRDQLMCDVTNNNARFDCFPNYGASEEECQARGCCWKVPDSSIVFQKRALGRAINIPYCFFPKNYNGYIASNLEETGFGFSATLQRETGSGWPNDVMKLKMDILFETETRIQIKIYDPSNKRYEVPIKTPKFSKKPSATDYAVHIQMSPFGIKITRKSTGAIIFDSTVAPLVFADQFLQISVHTGTRLIYGLGEHMTPLLLSDSWQQLAMWNRDIGPQFNSNLYGTHPFFLGLEQDGNAHGVFLLNSNAMDINLQPLPAVTFRTIGGILDLYILTGPSGDDVIQQYTDVVGKPYMPPYWSLGYHLCRWGYGGTDGLKKVINRNRELGIPYDIQWNDIDYMAAKRDWTYDTDQFHDLPEVVSDLHEHGQHYVIIVDPAISNTLPGEYPPYDEGLRDDIFIISNQTGKPLIGAVWPGSTVFPDFSNPKVTNWWYDQTHSFHKQIDFDGLWIDMNDPSNELFGSSVGCSTDKYDNPPYVPGLIGNDKLPTRTVCPSAHQYMSNHYDLHNLYGLQEAQVTTSVLEKLRSKRSLVISRSTYPSHGLYGGHWTGDIRSTWLAMQYTIPAILKFNMFGIPLVGSDICGFAGDTTEELCVRWTQLGAFYPFMRNHNMIGAKDQDPASFSYRAARVMKFVLEVRYSLLPYLYTLFYHSHMTGRTVARSLFFNFPSDNQTYSIDRQFMWGNALLISPVLDQGQTTVKAYFPAARWFEFYESGPVEGGQWVTLDAPLEKINVHVRGGNIIPLQEPNITTTLARTQPFHLLVTPGDDGTATGDLYWDDGDSLGTVEKGLYNLIQFKLTKGQVSSTVTKASYDCSMLLGTVRILGVMTGPHSITVNGAAAKYVYKEQQQELLIENLALDLRKPFNAQWK